MDPSERTRLVQRIADYSNESEDLVEMAFDHADGDILDTLMLLTAPAMRRRLERKHCERKGMEWNTTCHVSRLSRIADREKLVRAFLKPH